jgi:hypothetical protein
MTGAAAPPEAAFGVLTELAWIPVAACAIDARYQRSIASRGSVIMISRIANAFEWALFGVVTAARGDGDPPRFSVIDGQHRIEAARRRGIAHVPALVIAGADAAMQARLFVAANRNRVGLSPMAIHKAAVAAGDARALAIDAACAAAGVTIAPYPMRVDQMPPGATTAVSSIATIFRQYGGEALAATLRLVASAWPERGGIRSPRIRGVAAAINALGHDPVAAALLHRAMAVAVDNAAGQAAANGVALWRGYQRAISGAVRGDGFLAPIPLAPGGTGGPSPRAAEPAPLKRGLSKEIMRRCACGAPYKTSDVLETRCETCRRGFEDDPRAAGGGL